MQAVTIYDLISTAIAEGRLGAGDTFDTALPMPWAYDMHDAIGEWPREFVWHYPPRSIFGVPLPLTDTARDQLNRYNAARNRKEAVS